MTAHCSTGFLNAMFSGQAFRDIFDYGCIEIYSGEQPSNANAAVSGTLLGRVTRNGGLWTYGVSANGLRFTPVDRFVVADPSQTWRLAGVADGTAGWFRLRGNAYDDGLASSTAPRIDGRILLAGEPGEAQMYMYDLNITDTTNTPFVGWAFTIPPFAL